ncbi:MAG: putative oxidoreductase [Brevundimonas sp.]|nr:putative oxidoreductase [Brevundimonas sp.]
MTPADIQLDGQVAVITGGGGGIGEGIARAFSNFGAAVVLADIDSDKAETVAADIRRQGGRALAVATDVVQIDQIRAMAERTAAEFGRIDILVNNVAGVRRVAFLDMSERSRRRHVDINLHAYFDAVEACAPHMIAGGNGGLILNITSIEALRAAPMYSVYAACKAAQVSFTRTLALELSEHGIRVNAIAPDQVVTPGWSGLGADRMSPEIADPRHRYIPLGRDGSVDDIAGMAVYLASPMGTYTTGVTMSVDGGAFASSGWTRTADGDWSLFRR